MRAHSTTYSCVHWLRTKRSVIEDFPHPPSPQTVIVTRCESSMALTAGFQKRSKKLQSRVSRPYKIPHKSQTLELLYFPPPRGHTTAVRPWASGHKCDQAAAIGRVALHNECMFPQPKGVDCTDRTDKFAIPNPCRRSNGVDLV